MKNDQLIKLLLLGGLLLLMAAITRKNLLPGVEEIDQSLFRDPVQRKSFQKPFRKEVNDISYLIQPLYDYELSGMVVSYHDSDAWWDIYHHGSWQDFINIKDLCVVWGQNLQSEVYQDMTFDSDNWTCFAASYNQSGEARFRADQLSNNHLLSDSKEIQKLIMNVSFGDQIHFKGQLANYANLDNGSRRGTSISRYDSGNGACETIYVEEFEVIKENNPGWRTAYLVAKAAIALSLVLLVLNYLFGDVTEFINR